MRFWSIWRPGYPMALSEKIERTKDWASMELERLLPKRAAYWVAMVQIGRATKTSQNVPATSLDNVLENLGRVKDGRPLEQFKWHETMRSDISPDHEHIHVNPLDLDKLSPEEQAELPKVMQSFVTEKPLHERPLDNGKNGGDI